MPQWLLQCVQLGQYAPRDSLKLPFVLAPHPSCALPELPANATRLTAPRALKARKVVAHVERALGGGEEDEGALELWCGEKRVPAEMSLMTCRQFLWKQVRGRQRQKSRPHCRTLCLCCRI